MELRHRIVALNSSPEYHILKAELDRADIPYKIETLGRRHDGEWLSLECIVGENDSHFHQVEDLIRKHDFYVQSGIHYDAQDIEQSAWCYVSVGQYQYPQPEDTYIEATFDISDYCPWCGIGAQQTHPYRLKSGFKQKRVGFLGLFWANDAVFVRPYVKQILSDAKITGIDFLRPVHHRTNLPIEDVYQLVVEETAPLGLKTDELQAVTCCENNEEGLKRKSGRAFGLSRPLEQYPFCGRVKYHYPRMVRTRFTQESLTGLPDVVRSSEYSGSGGAAHRFVLVSNGFVEATLSHRIRGVTFVPVEVV